MSEFGTEKGLLQDHAERQLTHALKSRKLSESFQRSPFLGKFCKLLGITSSVLEFRSWTGKDVPVNLYQRNVFLCSDKKGQDPRAQFSPSKVPVLAKEADISWQLSRGPVPRTCPTVTPEGARHPGANGPSASSGHPNDGSQVPKTAS